jgi:hypothetical protein
MMCDIINVNILIANANGELDGFNNIRGGADA